VRYISAKYSIVRLHGAGFRMCRRKYQQESKYDERGAPNFTENTSNTPVHLLKHRHVTYYRNNARGIQCRSVEYEGMLSAVYECCYDWRMIFDAVPFRQTLSSSDIKARALGALAEYLEKSLGVRVVKDLRTAPLSRLDIREPLTLAALLKEHGVIQSFGPVRNLWPDMPRTKGWYAICNDPTSHNVGGTSWEDDESALYAALAEALERYIWMTQDDYFMRPIRATSEAIGKIGPRVAPEDFAGFSDEQRARYPQRQLRPDAEYLWIQGMSLVSNERVYVPAQTVSGIRPRSMKGGAEEPIIRQQNTNGLATWPTQNGARVAGMLEVIERDAYMMMWFNQLTLPRLALDSLCEKYPSLARAIAKCERFQFKTHVLQLPADAPTHAVAVVIEDMGGNAPRFVVGLKAHPSLPHAIEKAMTEALRAYRAHTMWTGAGNVWDTSTPTEKIGHRERLYYWGVPENAKHLEFMIRGPEIEIGDKAWDNDTTEEHYRRLVQWCKDTHLECISVPLTSSAKNPSSLHIEMVVMPQLQPTYLNEWVQQFGGTRWHDIPKALGYTPLSKPFADRPHPFS
jgi:ribosomal protein S12 methylthiotransferase accessory factor